jgi:hypothetical protein
MNIMTRTVLSMTCAGAIACAAGASHRGGRELRLRTVFGPAIGHEVIAGRAEDAGDASIVLLLAGERDLIGVDLRSHVAMRHPIESDGMPCWGLARLHDGTLWTIKGRDKLLQVTADGRVTSERQLDGVHMGLFGSGDRLLYEPANFTPPGPVLFAGGPADRAPSPWSGLTTRMFALARASAAALNLVSCGIGEGNERPCWFPDEAALSMIDASGRTRRVALSGLAVVAPEVLLTADNPARPVRDAYVDRSGVIWILSSGVAPNGREDQPGGWILARYTGAGEPLGVDRLAESVRMILRAGNGRALVVTGSGMVAEVTP